MLCAFRTELTENGVSRIGCRMGGMTAVELFLLFVFVAFGVWAVLRWRVVDGDSETEKGHDPVLAAADAVTSSTSTRDASVVRAWSNELERRGLLAGDERLGGLDVDASVTETPGGEARVELRFVDGEPLPAGAQIQPRSRNGQARTGDRAFDERFTFEGPDLVMRAVLDGPTRRAIRRVEGLEILAHDRLAFVSGSLADVGNLAALDDAITGLRDVPADVAARIEVIASTDDVPGVRAECIASLRDHRPSASRWRELRDAMAESEDSTVRAACLQRFAGDLSDHAFEHVLAYGPEREEVLVALLAADPPGLDATLQALLEQEPLSPEYHVDLQCRALAAALFRGLSIDEDKLVEVLRGDESHVAVEAVAPWVSSGPWTEVTLCRLLADAYPHVVRQHAADRLASVGTLSSLSALQQLTRREVRFLTRKAAQSAVAAIRKRHGGDVAGSIAVVGEGTEDGALSAVEQAAALSQVEDADS